MWSNGTGHASVNEKIQNYTNTKESFYWVQNNVAWFLVFERNVGFSFI